MPQGVGSMTRRLVRDDEDYGKNVEDVTTTSDGGIVTVGSTWSLTRHAAEASPRRAKLKTAYKILELDERSQALGLRLQTHPSYVLVARRLLGGRARADALADARASLRALYATRPDAPAWLAALDGTIQTHAQERFIRGWPPHDRPSGAGAA
jgi:hypothetical protein